MDSFHDRRSMEKFSCLKILATPNYLVYGKFSSLAVININLTIAPLIGMAEKMVIILF